MKLMGGRRTFPLPPPRPVMLVAGSYALEGGALSKRPEHYCSTGRTWGSVQSVLRKALPRISLIKLACRVLEINTLFAENGASAQ